MKLVDILARELAEWPGNSIDVTDYCVQSDETTQIFFGCPHGEIFLSERAENTHDVRVTRAEWQAAVDALNAPAVWGGEGLPPVGTVCTLSGPTERLHPIHPEWAGREVKIYAHFTSDNGHELAAYVGTDHMIGGVGVADLFVPIRTPEQVAAEEREKAIDKLVDVFESAALKQNYDMRGGIAAIYDAVYRKEKKPCGS